MGTMGGGGGGGGKSLAACKGGRIDLPRGVGMVGMVNASPILTTNIQTQHHHHKTTTTAEYFIVILIVGLVWSC